MTTDRKIFDFRLRRGIMAKTEYPGVAQLVGRDIWDVEVGCSSHLTRTTEYLERYSVFSFLAYNKKVPPAHQHPLPPQS